MAIKGVITSQTGGRQFEGNSIVDYSLFVGGVNATNHALRNYSPLLNGFGRLFMVRPPLVLLKIFAGGNDTYLYSRYNQFIQFKHMMEYMNRSVTNIQNKSLEAAGTPIQGGFAGRQFKTPTVTKVNTESFTVGMYELVGCPIRTVLDMWMNAIGDENSGLATYGGYISGGLNSKGKHQRLWKYSNQQDDTGIPFNEANHTAEFIYVEHDRSGAQVESAVLFADCWPTEVNDGAVLNMEAGGTHDNVTYEVTFNTIMYRSPIITSIADDLLKQYQIVSNSLNFNPELGDAVYSSLSNGKPTFSYSMGSVPMDAATGTVNGNIPVYNPLNSPTTRTASVANQTQLDKAKLSGTDNSEKEDWTNINNKPGTGYGSGGYNGYDPTNTLGYGG